MGVKVDASRGAVPRVDKLKQQMVGMHILWASLISMHVAADRSSHM